MLLLKYSFSESGTHPTDCNTVVTWALYHTHSECTHGCVTSCPAHTSSAASPLAPLGSPSTCGQVHLQATKPARRGREMMCFMAQWQVYRDHEEDCESVNPLTSPLSPLPSPLPTRS